MDSRKILISSIFLSTLSGLIANDFDYCTISPRNTMCINKPSAYGPACMKVFPMQVTETDKKDIVNLHNELRRRLAKGLEQRGSPGPQPSAANMRELQWDEELAMMAQTHAQQCTFKHDVNRNVARFAVGQNLAISFSNAFRKYSNWTAQIKSWYNEVAIMNNTYVAALPSNPVGGVIGHYTQLVWADTYTIGCGIVSYYDTEFKGYYPYKIFYACNYGPAGNYIRRKIYQKGAAATACPTATKPLHGLCV